MMRRITLLLAALAALSYAALAQQVTYTPSAAAFIPLPVTVANGGTNCAAASLSCFNNVTGLSAAGTTGTTSTNLVFSTSPTLVTPVLGAAAGTSLALNGCTIGSAILCASPTAAATASTDLNQASGGSALLAFASTAGISVNQIVSGTNIPVGDQVKSIVATGQATLTASGVSNSGQAVLTTTNTTGVAQGQQCVDLTTPSAIGDGNVILSVQAGVSITMTSNLTANTANNDSIKCDPVVTLSQASSGTILAAASIQFAANATTVSSSSLIYDLGDTSVAGNLNIGGNLNFGTIVPPPANGFYLQSANQVGVSTNSTLRWSFGSSGTLTAGVGGAPRFPNAASNCTTTPTLDPNNAVGNYGWSADGTPTKLCAVVNGSDVMDLTSTGINSAAIGASTASTGAFTTLSTSGNTTLAGLATDSGEATSRTVCQSTGTNANRLFFGSGAAGICKGTSFRGAKVGITDIVADLSAADTLPIFQWRYKPKYGDPKPLHYGPIAEDVAKAFPELAFRDGTGKVTSYDWPDLLFAMQARDRQRIDGMRVEIEILYAFVGLLLLWNIWLTIRVRSAR